MSLYFQRRRRFCIIAILFFFFMFIICLQLGLVTLSEDEQSLTCTRLCPYVSILTHDRLEFDSTHFIRHYPEFVCPQNFRNLADWIYGWPDQFNEHIETAAVGRRIASCLPHGSIIYVRRLALDEFFTKIYPYLINDFVLITGEGDDSSPNDIAYLERADSKIIHWFGQNGQIDASRSKKFTHTPIGINCYEMAEGIRDVYEQQPQHMLFPTFGDVDEPPHYVQPLDMARRALADTPNEDRNKLLLINYNPDTDWTGLRASVWKAMCDSVNKTPFATCISKWGGVYIPRIPKVYARNCQYSFWLSLRGNGIDCHRTWEALYLDVIPIVWNSSLNVLYEHLPIIIIQNSTEISETFLRQQLHDISKKKTQKTSMIYQFEKLRNAYWRCLILNKSRHSLTGSNIRRNVCWRAKTTVNWHRFLPSGW